MKTIPLTFNPNPETYDITIGTDIIKNIATIHDLTQYSSHFVVTDSNVAPSWLPTLLSALPGVAQSLTLPAGERNKHSRTVEQIWTALHAAGGDRKTLVITLGGGVIGDMAGFAAATYMRGIPFLHIPTSLLAQVDSSVGGKTGIDHDDIKNLVGTFSQPQAVIIDTTTLKTLPERELVSGFGEIIKHGLIADAAYFHKAVTKHPTSFTAKELAELVATSCAIKAQVAQSDEHESGKRKILNFGHTIGHAVEALSLATDMPLLHGEAVSIGMAIEAELSKEYGLSNEDAARIKDTLRRMGLPTICPDFPIGSILGKVHSDKKNSRDAIRLTVLESIGNATWDKEVSDAAITRAINQSKEQAP